MRPDEVAKRLAAEVFPFKEELRRAFDSGSNEVASARVRSLERLVREVRSSHRTLTNGKQDHERMLRRYLRNSSVVAFVEILEARALLELSREWSSLPSGAREEALRRVLTRGVEDLRRILADVRAGGRNP